MSEVLQPYPSSMWEQPRGVIDFLQDIEVPSNGDESGFYSRFLSGVSEGFTGVYRNLLDIAMRGEGFRIADEGQQVIDLYQDYALEVFRRGDGSICLLRLGMAKEDPLRFGSIDFTVNDQQKPEFIEVNDRVTKTGVQGLAEQVTRKLKLRLKANGEVEFDLDANKHRSFTIGTTSAITA